MTIALPAAAFDAPRATLAARWRRHGALLAVVSIALLALFRADAADMAAIWWNSSNFQHCLLIGPVIAWLVWQRRDGLARVTPVGWWPALAIVAAGGLAWLVGDAASVALARHFGLVVMLQGAVVAVLGPNVARALLFPIAYALFLVPFGDGLERPLQDLTASLTMPLLHLAGVPAKIDGVLITIPNGYFEVAEACSGTKFVIAMVAYGALVANVCFRSWTRRALFMATAIVVPLLANGVRAFGTIYVAHLTSVAQATGFDHIVYGWLFFAVVIAGVMALGWRWFDRAPHDAVFDPATLQAPPRHAIGVGIAAALVLATAAAFPLWSTASASRAPVLPATIALPEVAGWKRVPMSVRAPWAPHYPGADHFLIGRYADAEGRAVDLAIAVYASQREGKEIVAFGTGALRVDDAWLRIGGLADLAGGSAMRVTAPGPVERQIVTWYRIGDTLTGSERAVKLATLRAKLLGGDPRAVAVHVSAEVMPGADARAAIARFVAALGPIERVADRAAGTGR